MPELGEVSHAAAYGAINQPHGLYMGEQELAIAHILQEEFDQRNEQRTPRVSEPGWRLPSARTSHK